MNDLQCSGGLQACLQQFCEAVLDRSPAVSIYSRNYFLGHSRALERNHPLTRRRLGASRFTALARVYADHYPATDWDVNLYGESFADLLAAQVEGAGADNVDWPLIAAMARLEYAICRVYYAPDGMYGGPGALSIGSPHQQGEGICARELQALHPYADVGATLVPGNPAFVWRKGIRVQVSDSPPQMGGGSREC